MRKPVRFAAAAIALCLIVALGWFSHHVRQTDRAIGDIYGFHLAMEYYLIEHDGNLPASMDDFRDGYCRVGDDGVWKVIHRPDLVPGTSSSFSIDHPEWFDVAWGAKADEIDANGVIAGNRRPIVQASDATPDWFKPMAGRLSPWLAQTIAEIRTANTATAPISPTEP